MDIFGRDVFEVCAIDLGGNLHIVTHAGLCYRVADICGDLKDATAVAYPQALHGRCDGEANGSSAARNVGYDKIVCKGIEPSIDAFHTCIERFQVNAEVDAFPILPC